MAKELWFELIAVDIQEGEDMVDHVDTGSLLQVMEKYLKAIEETIILMLQWKLLAKRILCNGKIPTKMGFNDFGQERKYNNLEFKAIGKRKTLLILV